MSEQFLRCIQEKHTSGSLKPNELDHSGLSLVHQAAKDGQLTCLKWLMKFGGDVEVKSSEGLCPSHYAAGEGHLQILQYLHERKRESISIKSEKNITPLHLAAQEGQLDCLIWLSKSSSLSVDTQTDEGVTAAHFAAQEGRMECLRYLIKAAHAQIKIVDNFGCGLLHYAASEGHWKLVKWLVNHCGMSCDERDYSGAIPLHVAAGAGHENVIHMLIKCGTTLHIEDNEGKTALDYAIERKQKNCVEAIRNMMFRSPEDLRNLKKVRFNELVYTYDIRSPLYKSTYSENKGSSDYWDEVIQSQFDYWRNSPQQTKRERQLKEKRNFYKGRTKNLNCVPQQHHQRSRDIIFEEKEEIVNSSTSCSDPINYKDPPDLLKHINDRGQLDDLILISNGTMPMRNRHHRHPGIHPGGSATLPAPPVPKRHSINNTTPPPVPVRHISTGKIPPAVPKRTGTPKFPLGSSQDSRNLESRGYHSSKRPAPRVPLGDTNILNNSMIGVIEVPQENSTPTHTPQLNIPFNPLPQEQPHTTKNPLYREKEPLRYVYPQTKTQKQNGGVGNMSMRNSTYDSHGNRVNRLVNQYDSFAQHEIYSSVNTNDSNKYMPFTYLNHRTSEPKAKSKNYQNGVISTGGGSFKSVTSSKSGRVSRQSTSNHLNTLNSNASMSSFDSHLHDISIGQFTDRSKVKLYSRNLGKSKPSTWTAFRNGISQFFNSIRPKRDPGRSTWSDPRYSQREDIFSRFSLPRKASRREFDDLFNNSIEGNYTISKNTSFSSIANSGRLMASNLSLEENRMKNTIGASPYDRFRTKEIKNDSFSGFSDFSADMQGPSSYAFESFLSEPPITSTMRRVRKEKTQVSTIR